MQHSMVTEGMVDAVHTTKDRYACMKRSQYYAKTGRTNIEKGKKVQITTKRGINVLISLPY